jgi:hypothetical protein
MRGKLSAYCWLPLDRVIYTGMDAALEDGVEKLYVSAAAFLSRHPSVANYFTVELAALKELSQELAELFNLTLPVSLSLQSVEKLLKR